MSASHDTNYREGDSALVYCAPFQRPSSTDEKSRLLSQHQVQSNDEVKNAILSFNIQFTVFPDLPNDNSFDSASGMSENYDKFQQDLRISQSRNVS